MVRSWGRAVFILAMSVPLGIASAAAIGPPALASPEHGSVLASARDLPQASAAPVGPNLLAVSATSATNAWAVGYKCSTTSCSPPDLPFSTLIEHWNGRRWSTVPSPDPNPGPFGDELTGVSAVSATDAWAVGSEDRQGFGSPVGDTLILHWNGRKWTRFRSPNPAAGTETLTGVTAISATDAWITGSYFPGSGHTLILHWNGRKWTRVASPNPDGAGLLGVSAASAADAWAAGEYRPPGPSSPISTLTVHWNGRKWTRVPSPNPGIDSNELFGVSTVAPTDAWAVGYYDSIGLPLSLILHWNGKKWARVASPDPGTAVNQLSGVSAISSTDAWAVGQYTSGRAITGSTLILHWNGKKWAQVASPNPDASATFNYLLGVSTVSPRSAFAAGVSVNQTTGPYTALAARWNGKKWS